MRFVRILMLVSATMLGSLQANAAGVDFRVADKAAEMFYMYKSSTFGYGGSDVSWGYFFNEADDKMLSASVLVSGNGAGGSRAFQFGVGFKGFYALYDQANVEGGGLGLGGLVRYVFASSTPIAILAEGYVVPKITSVGDAEDFNEWRIALELEVSPSARAYIGHRKTTMSDANGNDYDLDNDDIHVGIRINF